MLCAAGLPPGLALSPVLSLLFLGTSTWPSVQWWQFYCEASLRERATLEDSLSAIGQACWPYLDP